MNVSDKIEKLKAYYLKLEHPLWGKDKWHKKINDIFLEKRLKGKFSVEEYFIRTLEYNFNVPDKRIKLKYDILSYMEDGEEKEKLKNELEQYELNKKITFNENVKKRLEWYNNL